MPVWFLLPAIGFRHGKAGDPEFAALLPAGARKLLFEIAPIPVRIQVLVCKIRIPFLCFIQFFVLPGLHISSLCIARRGLDYSAANKSSVISRLLACAAASAEITYRRVILFC